MNLSNMKKYTLGFIFNETLDKVLLINKLAPDWQVGKLNGLGGKVEEGEDGLTCIVREVKEESGLETISEDWEYVCKMYSPDFDIDTFSYIYKSDLNNAKSMELEKIEWCDVKNLPYNVIGNLNWLIPMSIDKLTRKEFTFKKIDIEYK